MLQSRAFRRTSDFLFDKLKFVLRHPIKSLLFIVKLYITLLLFMFLTVFFFGSISHAQELTVYDRTPSVAPEPGKDCHCAGPPFSGISGQCGGVLSAGPGWAKEQLNQQTQRNVRNDNIQTTLRPDEGVCIMSGTIVVDDWAYDPTNGWQDTGSDTTVAVYGGAYIVNTSPGCVPDGGTGFERYIEGTTNGETRCFSEFELAQNSSCQPGSGRLASASDPAQVCVTESDGSQCVYNKGEAGGQAFYQTSPDLETCYGGDIYIWNDTYSQAPTGTECQPVGGGATFCPKEPTETCPGGQCPPGCGSFTFQGEAHFGCFDEVQPPEPPEGPEGPGTVTTPGGAVTVTIDTTGLEEGLFGPEGPLAPGQPIDYTLPEDIRRYGEPNDYDTRNFGTVMESAVEEMQNSDVSRAVNEFFEVSLSGSCPIYSGAIPGIGNITIDQFCGPVMASVWPIISAIMILVFSYMAFRVAIL